MESGRMTNETPIGQIWNRDKVLEKSLVDEGWFSKCCILQDNVTPTQNKTQDRYTSIITNGNKKENLLTQIAAE
jgi:hypothetical protein